MNTMKTSENTIMLPGINVNMFFFLNPPDWTSEEINVIFSYIYMLFL